MPEKKKLKKRIRARMVKTGERYTEARFEEVELVEDAVRSIQEAWKDLDVFSVMRTLWKFYRNVPHDVPMSSAVVMTHVLEILTDGAPESIRSSGFSGSGSARTIVKETMSERIATVREFLVAYQRGPVVPPGMGVFQYPRSPHFAEHVRELSSGASLSLLGLSIEEFPTEDEIHFEDTPEGLERLKRFQEELEAEIALEKVQLEGSLAVTPLERAQLENRKLREMLRSLGISPDL